MTITYQFETEGENKRIVFKDKDGNDIFDISCISDIHFVRLVDYLVKQINVGQVIECTCSNDVAYKFTEKERHYCQKKHGSLCPLVGISCLPSRRAVLRNIWRPYSKRAGERRERLPSKEEFRRGA